MSERGRGSYASKSRDVETFRAWWRSFDGSFQPVHWGQFDPHFVELIAQDPRLLQQDPTFVLIPIDTGDALC